MNRLYSLKVSIGKEFTRINGSVTEDHDYISLVLTPDEVRGLTKPHAQVVTDIGHRLDVWRDYVRIYDPPTPRYDPVVSRSEVKCITLRIPQEFWAYLDRLREENPPGEDDGKEYLDLTREWRKRFMRQHGTGRGHVQVRYWDRNVGRWVWRIPMVMRNRALREKIAHVVGIAKGSTSGMDQTAELKLSPDGDGYYWEAFTPKGNRIMNGGIINHGSEQEPDWSIHT
jgi:hypothetical protein